MTARVRIIRHGGRRFVTLPNSHGESVARIVVPARVSDAEAIRVARDVFPTGTPNRRAQISEEYGVQS